MAFVAHKEAAFLAKGAVCYSNRVYYRVSLYDSFLELVGIFRWIRYRKYSGCHLGMACWWAGYRLFN